MDGRKPIIAPGVIGVALIASVCAVIAIISSCNKGKPHADTQDQPVLKASSRNIPAGAWRAPDSTAIPIGKAGDMIRYGKELLAHTGRYFGPNGSVAKISNGMNCQNCHMDGGRRLFGNNYASFIAYYPKMNNRSGKVDRPTDRIVQCFNRSLAGHAPDTNGHEVKAMLAYMKWVGKDVKKRKEIVRDCNRKIGLYGPPG